jgi:hypothetical protein
MYILNMSIEKVLQVAKSQ